MLRVRPEKFNRVIVLTLTKRRAAALATGCTVQIDQDPPYYDVKQNPVLGQLVLSLSIDSMRYQSCYHAIPTTAKIFSEIVQTQYGHSVYTYGSSASTDFVSVHMIYIVLFCPHSVFLGQR